MTLAYLAAFVVIAAFAAAVQTLTGFAFGLVMMGAVTLSGLLPLPEAAVLVGSLTLVNASQMLIHGGWREVARRELRLILSATLPTIGIGYVLLERLADTQADLLRLALGAIIMLSSLQLALRPRPLPERSPAASFIGVGIVSGLMAGLFSTGGPPLVYHLYRQPLPLAAIRETLVAAFGVAQLLRLALVAASGNMPPPSTLSGLLAIPFVMAATYAARRWPPPLSVGAMRRIVFVLLFLSGLSLALPAVLHLLAASTQQ